MSDDVERTRQEVVRRLARLSGDWSEIDARRLARHETLMGLWRDLPADEIMLDIGMAAHLAAFKARALTPLEMTKQAVAAGAGHECSEWADNRDGHCAVCGKPTALGGR